ncbi:hypothetical protein GW7_20131 [Heterocephalus glaber]|uniref:Uncharacterized protein n=1 Tax=Heterocephalus glaber TaxID=10181 RepID=G5BQW7_HETGA|nr:hypothetical protein GW7_20131 [Heterocephalus glaber]
MEEVGEELKGPVPPFLTLFVTSSAPGEVYPDKDLGADTDRALRAHLREWLQHKHTHVRPAPAARTRPEAPAATTGARAVLAAPTLLPRLGLRRLQLAATAPRRARRPEGCGCARWATASAAVEAEKGVSAPEPRKSPGGGVAWRGPLRKTGAVTGRPVRRRRGRPRRSSKTGHGLRHILAEQLVVKVTLLRPTHRKTCPGDSLLDLPGIGHGHSSRQDPIEGVAATSFQYGYVNPQANATPLPKALAILSVGEEEEHV